MAVVKISDLPPAAALVGTEVAPIVQAGTTDKIPVSSIANLAQLWLSGSSIAGGGFSGATATTSASTISLLAGPGISISQNSSNAITISAAAVPKLSFTQIGPLQEAGLVLTGLVTTTGATAAVQPFNSSLFLQRIALLAPMTLTEMDIAIGLAFPAATSDGQGSISQTFALYSFGNSTSLATVFSVSGSSSWATGSATQVGQSFSQSQVAWSGSNVKPFTFAATAIPAGEYVVGRLLAFAGQSTSWTVSLFGANAAALSSLAAMTAVTSATLSAASTFATASTSMTAFSASPTAANALSSGGLAAVSAFTSSASAAITAFAGAPTGASVLVGVSGTSTALLAASAHTASGSAAITAFAGAPAGASVLVAFSGTSTALIAGSVHTASAIANVLSSSALAAASGISGISAFGTAFLALSTSGNVGAVQTFTLSAASAAASSLTASALVSVTDSGNKSASFALVGVNTNTNILSSIGTVAGSIHTASASAAVLSTNGLLAGSFFTASTSVLAFTGGTGASSFLSTNGLLGGSFFTASSSVLAYTGGTGASSFLSTGGLSAGSFVATSGSVAAISNAGTAGAALALSLTTGSIAAVTAVGAAALSSASFATITLPQFGFIGTQSEATTAGFPFAFLAGIMSTGAAPASIALTTSALTATGSIALVQPWFAMIGS